VLVCLPSADDIPMLGKLPDSVEFTSWDGRGDPPRRTADVDFLIAPYAVRLSPGPMLAALPNLSVVQLLSAGADMWLGLVPDRVTLCRGVGVHADSTADLALALMLSLARHLPDFVDAQHRHEWAPSTGVALADQRVLVVGAGDIGQALGRRVAACGSQVTYVGRTAREGVHGTDELAALLPSADVVAIVVPLTDQTRHLVDAEFLAAMPDGAALINVARGAVVDTQALAAEITSGRLRAGLDVTDPEPLPADHPLWNAPNVVITPHIGGGTTGWVQRAFGLAADQIRRYVSGEPLLYQVNGSY
jgi:phosphoglycerate dehydrogenase-like enzyme